MAVIGTRREGRQCDGTQDNCLGMEAQLDERKGIALLPPRHCSSRSMQPAYAAHWYSVLTVVFVEHYALTRACQRLSRGVWYHAKRAFVYGIPEDLGTV